MSLIMLKGFYVWYALKTVVPGIGVVLHSLLYFVQSYSSMSLSQRVLFERFHCISKTECTKFSTTPCHAAYIAFK